MKAHAYKEGIFRVLESCGFTKHGSSLRREQDGVIVLISVERGLADQWHINAGFWLSTLGELLSDRVEKSHIYCRLERLAPMHKDVILASGALMESDQQSGYDELLTLLSTDIDEKLRAIGTERGLRFANREGTLPNGLVRAEARTFLDGA